MPDTKPTCTPEEFHARIMRQVEIWDESLVRRVIEGLIESLNQSDRNAGRELPRHVENQDEARVLRNLRNLNARAQVRSVLRDILSSELSGPQTGTTTTEED